MIRTLISIIAGSLVCCFLFQLISQLSESLDVTAAAHVRGWPISRRHSEPPGDRPNAELRASRPSAMPPNYAPTQLLNADDIRHREHRRPFPEPSELIRPDEFREELWQLRLVASTIVDPINEDRRLLLASELIQFFGAPGARWLLFRMGRVNEITAVDNWLHLNRNHPSATTGPLAQREVRPLLQCILAFQGHVRSGHPYVGSYTVHMVLGRRVV